MKYGAWLTPDSTMSVTNRTDINAGYLDDVKTCPLDDSNSLLGSRVICKLLVNDCKRALDWS